MKSATSTQDTPSRTGAPWLLALVGAIIIALFTYYALRLYAPCDDAYIFLVYAQSLIEGQGLTFNGTRVEGFTSTLWMALLALGALTRLPLPALAEGLSLVSGILGLVATYYLGRRAGLKPVRALLPPALLAALGDFAFYSSVGLETALFSALCAVCAGLTVGAIRESAESATALLRSRRLPLWLLLMVLARPEGALVAGLLLSGLLVRTQALWPTLRCGLTLSAGYAPVLLARFLYYGFWLPNTYYAKAGAGLANLGWGLDYLDRARANYMPVLVALACAVLFAAFRRQPRALTGLWLLLAISVAWLAVIAVQGGDNLPGGRMLVPIAPIVLVGLGALTTALPLRVALPAALVLAAAMVWSYSQDRVTLFHVATWRQEFVLRRAAGEYLRANYPADTLVALNPAGVIPFHSRLPTLDMLGLNDVHIAHHGNRDRSWKYAHQAGDGAYVLAQKPDVILFGGTLKGHSNRLISGIEISQSPDFLASYEVAKWKGIGTVWVRRAE